MSQYPGQENPGGHEQPRQVPTYPNQTQPPSYSSTQFGQYTDQGAYAGYAQAYGQGMPAHMEGPVRPQQLNIAGLLMYAMVGLGLLSTILSTIFYEDIRNGTFDGIMATFAQSLPAEDQAIFKDQAMGASDPSVTMFSQVVGLVWSLIWNGLLVFFTLMMLKGRHWARVVLTVYAAFQILSLLQIVGFFIYFHWSMLFSPLVGVLAIVFLVYVWRAPVSTYMQQTRIYQQWKLQRAYMGSGQG